MIHLIAALLLTTAQDTAPVSADQEQSAQASQTASSEPEKICKRKVRSTGEGIAGLKATKVCRTKAEWDRLKANSAR